MRMLTVTALRRARVAMARQQMTRGAAVCLSTAPMPKQQISISYEEWAAAKKPATNANRRNQPQRQQPRRIKPQKYNSMVHLPETLSLKWPNDSNKFQLECLDFSIAKPGKGGHVVLGPNGTGKSLLVQYLVQPELVQGLDDDIKTLPAKDIAYVSFDSHLKVLQDHPHTTVHHYITGGHGNLSKAAQYLVVRFGLFPLLHRTLSTLSTGEIRKCLLVGALAQEPRLLILENPFDGLDVKSRTELQSIVSKTIQGLNESGKLLVQHVQAANVPPAQVLMSTHRPEEIVPEISTISYIQEQPQHASTTLMTIPRPPDYSQEQLMFRALGLDKDHNKNTQNWSIVAPWEDTDPTLPSKQEIQEVWDGGSKSADTLLALDHVEIQRRQDGGDSEFATLLQSLSWEIQKGQRWLIAGENGAGKSTLSRFLLQEPNSIHNDSEEDMDCTRDLTSGVYNKNDNTTIGWVSTESHLGQVGVDGQETSSSSTAWDVITHNGQVPETVAQTIAHWVFGSDSFGEPEALQQRSLHDLSQGQQKLVLLASALALRPNLLVLDEMTQGLDWFHRRRVLALLERICQAQAEDLSLVYITHYQEEWIPSISHVLHLDKGQAVYQGDKKNYNPRDVVQQD